MIDYSRDTLLSEAGIAVIKDRYLFEGETSPQDGFARAAKAFASNQEHAERIYDYASKRWFMFSSPILSNGGTKRGLPISCFLPYVPDSREGIFGHWTECGWLASNGGGIGGYWGHVRSVKEKTANGSQSNGCIPFIKVSESQMAAVSQGTTRRGSYAAYLDISHPEIEEFIHLRKPTGGDPNRKALNIHHGVNITDDFMEAVEQDLHWELLSPKTGNPVRTVKARELWQAILEVRLETGEPYLHFIDTSNRDLDEAFKYAGLKIHQSNLCSEIILPTNEHRTAVCCLSSVNVEKFHEWRGDPNFIPDLVEYLDNVLSAFCKRASEYYTGMEKAVYSAEMSRDIGLGAMGFHAFLQSMGISIESPLAKSWNNKVFSHIRAEANRATEDLAHEKGKAPDAGGDIRNCHLIAIAPNATSSIMCNTSPSIEPYAANTFTQKTDSGSFVMRNKFLSKLIKEKYSEYEEEIWETIVRDGGSCQTAPYLSEEEKQVFKTAWEIDQRVLVDLAADRQEHIDQAQSLNLFFLPTAHKGFLHDIHFRAFKKGLKTLYYVRSKPIRGASTGEEWKPDDNECLACEG